MSIKPISFLSTKTSQSTIDTREQRRIRHKNNPFRNTDLVPLSVCCGVGLMGVYAVKSGKIQAVKKMMHII